MKRIVALTALAGVTAAAGAGITFALFTASASPDEPVEFVAGTLELQGDRDNGDTVPGPMFYIDGSDDGLTEYGDEGFYPTGLWAPGDAHHRVFQIENIGTLDAKITSFTAELQEGDAELAGALDVKIFDNVYMDTDGNVVDPGANLLYEGKLADLFTTGAVLSPAYELYTGNMASFGILVSFPLDAGNEYQGDSIKVKFTAHAEQLRNN